MADTIEANNAIIRASHDQITAAKRRIFQLRPNYTPLEYLVSSKYNQYLLDYKVYADNNLNDDNYTDFHREIFYFSDFNLDVNYCVNKSDNSSYNEASISINFELQNSNIITIQYKFLSHPDSSTVEIIDEIFQTVWLRYRANLEVLLNNNGTAFFEDLNQNVREKLSNYREVCDKIE